MAEEKPIRTPSGQKRARQNEKRNLRNKAVLSRIKTFTKNIEAALDTKDGEQADKALRAVVKAISSAASKGILHRNTASRKISRLSKLVNRTLKAGTA